MRRKSPSGFVLLVVLVFLQFFILLSLFGLTNVKLMLKASYDNQGYDRLLLAAKQFLFALSNDKNVIANCDIPISEPASIAMQTKSWWQMHACSDNYNGIQYYYVVEALGAYPCTMIIDGNSTYIAKFDRITLLAESTNWDGHVILQSTKATPSKEQMKCAQTVHFIKEGRQMFREI